MTEIIELSDPQYDFLTSTKKHTGFVAGFGSGKSFIGTLKSLNKIINHNIPKTAYYLPTYGDIRDIAFDTFPTVADMLGYKYRLNKSDKTFTLFDNDGTVIGMTIFRNMSEPETIVGYQVGYTLIDETDILKEAIMDKAFKKILGRNRLIVEIEDEEILNEIIIKGGLHNAEYDEENNYYYYSDLNVYFHPKRESWCWVNNIDVAGTPEGFKWFYKRFVQQFKGKTDLLIKASTYSNMDNLPADFIETLRAEYPPELFDAYVNGDFVNLTSGTIFKYFNRKIHHSDEIENAHEVLTIGQDFNIGGCVSIVYVERFINGVMKEVAVEEFESYDTRDIIFNINQRYPNRIIDIYPDASGSSRKTSASESDIAMLMNAGFNVYVNSTNPSVKDRINTTNNMFAKDRLLVNTNRCPKYANALEQHAYDEKGEPDKFNTAASIDDFTDAGTYPIAYKHPIFVPVTQTKIMGL